MKDDLTLVRVRNINAVNQFNIFGYICLAEHELCVQHISNGIKEDDYGASTNDIGMFINDISKYYISHDTECVVAMIDGASIGFVAYNKVNNGELYIISLYVDKEYRRLGIATRLIDEVLKYDYEYAKVLIGDFNKESINFFNKLGFKLSAKSEIIGMSEYRLTEKEII